MIRLISVETTIHNRCGAVHIRPSAMDGGPPAVTWLSLGCTLPMPGLTFIAQALAERRFRFVARLDFSVAFRSQYRHKATPPNPSLLFSWQPISSYHLSGDHR
ncbi:hypothetical protein FOQG_03367 [Fusarium oxysporum f. sp. raphani 54005]|uniref:Uncharacterized protein n=4 Tax=Fusarium oxysporum TaxID=5507 RepID=X0CQ69_FUSOX|nr:hypothetical protein FOVG_00365 [Fusarium oxysporum f. sp. pisi HDV247]EXK96271.1 hypothetical protein FOQG_03367 [Fusarium oxysporum f. sp. raphani 54005]EXL89296.1 hypothetical protein FOPG_00044 [Fusarium oxysporum f. sp. conglutinans race 2 54008]EXM30487.1 hypothetical protein FOTG_04446 [Fusarium oxysporum f. sp. vasinfectum 25433]